MLRKKCLLFGWIVTGIFGCATQLLGNDPTPWYTVTLIIAVLWNATKKER